jgi:shikimate dehydrogenase
MSRNFKAELVGAFGDPIAENPTGVMQEAGFHAAGLDWRYLTLEVKAGDLAAAVAGARAIGMRGFNLTIPHKVAVIEHLDGLSKEAETIGAVNTVCIENGRLTGENTDGKGFLRGVRQDAGVDPAGKRVVLLGAGGAARAIAAELLLTGVRDLLVVNRSTERGEQMTADLRASTGKDIRFEQWQGTYVVPSDLDLFVNATSIGLYPDVNAMPDVDLGAAAPGTLVCDVVFNPPETPLLRAARDRGLPTLDGLSMLVYQGVIAFKMWTGQEPDADAMKAALSEALGI